jgi:DNA polymerase-1
MKEKFAAFVHELEQQREFAFDTETTGLSPVGSDLVGISISWKAGEGYYIPVRAMIGAVLPLEHVVSGLGPIFNNPSITKVGQNCN